MADIITLAEYKAAKGYGSADATYDLQLAPLIAMVNDFLPNYCHRTFGVGTTFVEKGEGVVDVRGRYFFRFMNPPVTSVTSIQIKFYGTTEFLTVDTSRLDLFGDQGYAYYDYVLDPLISVVRLEYRSQFYYIATYVGGKAVPAALKLAAIYIVSDTFEYLNRTASHEVTGKQTSGELRSVTIGDYSETYNTSETLLAKLHDNTSGLILTPTVRSIVDGYRVSGQSW